MSCACMRKYSLNVVSCSDLGCMMATIRSVQIQNPPNLACERQATHPIIAAGKHAVTGLQGEFCGEYVLLLVTVHRAQIVVTCHASEVAATCMVRCLHLHELLK